MAGPVREPVLLLRLMAEVGGAGEAEEELRLIVPRIEGYAAIEKHTIERYWKIPAYWEITLHLRPLGSAQGVYERLLGLAEGGWTRGAADEADGDRWAVWNAAPGVELLTPRIRWAELQLRSSGATA